MASNPWQAGIVGGSGIIPSSGSFMSFGQPMILPVKIDAVEVKDPRGRKGLFYGCNQEEADVMLDNERKWEEERKLMEKLGDEVDQQMWTAVSADNGPDCSGTLTFEDLEAVIKKLEDDTKENES